jgi:glucan phosphoethanolaminetransferase (alkaline phosphatase superfamily)
MRSRLKYFFHSNTAGAINLFIWSALFTAYLLFDRYNGGIDGDFLLTYIYLFITIIILNALLFYILRFCLYYFRYGSMTAYLVSNLTVTMIFFINNMAVMVYGKQLGSEGAVMAYRGWVDGEMGDFTSSVIKLLLFTGIYLGLFYGLYRILNIVLSGRSLHFNFSIISISVIVLLAVILHFRLVALADTDVKMNLMKNKIPWQSITGFPEDRIKVDEDGKKSNAVPPLFANPDFLDEKMELEQLKKLNLAKDKILAQNITAKSPMNILFINIEGLRNDMLNPVNMPFLFKFASERGFILKKHYTTGNNTPGSLFGMLTGLAPYYFEPLRGNKFINMPLHILKKAGYTQSFYYNSPHQYEYIHRDIIEKTEDKFSRAPGTKLDDYGPREQILIDRFISDLKSDKGNRRFDYYLMNVTHFNYFYPESCKKFIPDYNANFTIISGTQEKFKKDRVELKNRYMNAVCYTDQLLRQLITEMDRMGRLNNTILVVSGDHGEEFWEHGSFGHTWGLNNIQIQPAAFIYYPGVKKNSIKYRYTSHQDFMPTVFDLIGLNADWSQFTTGKSLVNYNADLDYAVSSLGILVSFKRNGYAIMGNGYKVLYKNNMDLNSAPYAVYDDDDRPVERFDTYKVVDLLLKTKSSKRLAAPKM